jgi:hypothetical protein
VRSQSHLQRRHTRTADARLSLFVCHVCPRISASKVAAEAARDPEAADKIDVQRISQVDKEWREGIVKQVAARQEALLSCTFLH